MKAINLRTAHLDKPLGIDVIRPLLTWNVINGEYQTAYQIVATCDGKEVWNTEKVASNTMSTEYNGHAESRKYIEWRIRVWDENDVVSEWSDTTHFEYAFLDKNEWKAKWITPETFAFNSDENQPASVIKKSFSLEKLGKARAYVTSHGIYALYINGMRIKDNLLTPGTSEYWYRLPYQTYDVSKYLALEENEIKVVLGDGWYRGCNGNMGTRNVFGTDVALLLQLEIDEKPVLVTDESWIAAQDGEIYFNDIQLGEKIDARKTPTAFHGVKVQDFGCDNLICTNTLPICERETFKAKLINTPDGSIVLDFGQNISGYVSFKLNAKDGQRIKMTHGEYLDSNGNFSDSNFETIGRKQQLHQVVDYICKDGVNEYCPTLCIFGFQMVKIETDVAITGEEFIAHAVYSDMAETAEFECDKPLVNKLFKNTVWSQKSNFVDVPTDCPQRERSGWTGDAGVFVSTGLMLMDSYPVFERWLGECRVDQYEDGRVYNMSPRRQSKPSKLDEMYDGSCGWGDATVIVPYAMYKLYGDKKILEENYDMMCRWLGYCEKKAGKHRLKNLFKKNPYKKYIIDTGIHWGEWLEAGVSTNEAMKNVILNGVPEIATAYFSYSSRIMSEVAKILGKPEDAKKFSELAEITKQAYNYLEVKNGRISSDRQCRFVRPLYMGLLNEEGKANAAKDLNELVVSNGYHLNTGFLTTPYICKVLADNGYVETAYKLLLQEDAPGWLFAVKNGATTIWESWEGNLGATGFASLNHYSKGAVVSWLIEGICGICVKQQEITIKPQVCPLMKFARASFDSPVGRIESKWEYEGEEVRYEITIPSNTTARFVSPDGEVVKLHHGVNVFTY